MLYQNFDLEIISPNGSGRLCARVLESPQGDCPFIDVKWPFDAEEENALLAEIYGGLRQRRARSSKASTIQDFGGKLFEAVFSGDIEHLFRSSLDSAFRAGKGLRVRLRLPEDSELHVRPWEFLFDTESREFLAVREHTPLIRYLPVAQPIPPITVEGPLRVLVALSSPTDHPRLDTAREWDILLSALEPSISAGQLELRRVPGRCTFDNLRDSLRHYGAHIFHFVGHGIPGALVLEQESGKGLEMEATHLRSAFPSGALPRLIVLNACSGAITQDVPFSGLAQGFLRQGVPAVVAMQASITDDAALIFTRYFYRDLVEIGAVDASLTEARLRMQGNGHPIEWGTPVLYMRALSGQLFQPPANPVPCLAANLAVNPPMSPAGNTREIPAAIPTASPAEAKRPKAATVPPPRVEPSLNEQRKIRVVPAKQPVPPQPGANPAEKKKPKAARPKEHTPPARPAPDRTEQHIAPKVPVQQSTPFPEPGAAAHAIPPAFQPAPGIAPSRPEAPAARQETAPVIPAAEPIAPPQPEPHPVQQDTAPQDRAEEAVVPPTPPHPAEPAIVPASAAAEAAGTAAPDHPAGEHLPRKTPGKKFTPPPRLEPILDQPALPQQIDPGPPPPTFLLDAEPEQQDMPAEAAGPAAPPASAATPSWPPPKKRMFVYGSAVSLLGVVLVLALGVDRFLPAPAGKPDAIAAEKKAPETASTVESVPATGTGNTTAAAGAPDSKSATAADASTRPDAGAIPAITPDSKASTAIPETEAPRTASSSGAQAEPSPAKATKAPAARHKALAGASRKAVAAHKPVPAPVDNCKNAVVSERDASCLFQNKEQ